MVVGRAGLRAELLGEAVAQHHEVLDDLVEFGEGPGTGVGAAGGGQALPVTERGPLAQADRDAGVEGRFGCAESG
ncbi:hypothetical protein AB0878_04360 [Amycolatopsis sp. NPDC047767]|uniref:hypothetical protein n=1 Tax=Amycolatopsis sp. NPDC047767 TaxID=3156765 RepID=UPI0034558909